MRSDIRDVAYDHRKHGWSARKDHKTAKKLNLKNLRDEDQNSISHKSMPRGWNRSWPNHKLLEGFLQSRVGKNWDKVYSEFCKNSDVRTDAGRDLRKALLNLIATDVTLDEKGRIHGQPRWGWGRNSELEDDDFYVDPKTNVVKKYKRKNQQVDRKWVVNHIDWLTINNHVHYHWTRTQVDDPDGKYEWSTKWVSGWERVTFRLVTNDEYKDGNRTENKLTGEVTYGPRTLLHKAGEWVQSGVDRHLLKKHLDEADLYLREEIKHILDTGKRLRSGENNFSKAHGVYMRKNRLYY